VNEFVNQIRSATPGITWPAIPGQEAATLLALQFQLERSQWLARERLRELQFRQLEALSRHAYETVPYYGERWHGLFDPSRPLTPEAFSRLPLLTRGDLQSRFDALRSHRIPAAHGAVTESRTSGSTGMPVRVLKTGLARLIWRAIVLREHRWFERDLSGKLAAIRQGVAETETDGWGPATNAIARTGHSATLPISADVDSQLDWLARQQPDYLLTYPSNLAELVRRSLVRPIPFSRLREVRTFGELLAPETRALCREAWGVPVTDAYSADETGYIALQCPATSDYHVQSEAVLVEVLDGNGAPCAPGQCGQVVVTDMHNFATPLVRYAIGDYAEVGGSCRCGRGLPVLTRILGRVRNMLVTATGERYWPLLGVRGLAEIAPVLQAQFVQKDHVSVEARLVMAAPPSAEQEAQMRRHALSRLPPGIGLKFVYCREIPRGAGGKFEDFVSEVAAAP